MGVSIEVFRCRVGLFNLCRVRIGSSHSDHDLTGICLSFRLIPAAALCFLLLISGIELNPGPDLFKCKYCSLSLESAAKYCEHIKVHRHRKNFGIACCFCSRRMKTPNAFQTHVSKHHQAQREQLNFKPMDVTCSVQNCKLKLESRKDYMHHMTEHLKKNEFFKCPLCKTKKLEFRMVNKFRVHTSLYHPANPITLTSNEIPVSENLSATSSWEVSAVSDEDQPNIESDNDDNISLHEHSEDIMEAAERDPYPSHVIKDELARYYLKLEGEFVLPTSTVQQVADETQLMTELSHHCLKNTLQKELKNIGLQDDTIKSVISSTFKSDVVFNVHHKGEDFVHFGTDHMRSKYWRRRYPYVEPKEIQLANGKFAHYISIRATIQHKLKDPAIKAMVLKSFEPREKPDPSVLTDFTDGSAYVEHKLQHSDGRCLMLMLFQDAFEFNPFGPAAGVYKPIGFYYTLGNIAPEYRCSLDLIQLVFMVLEKSLQPTQQEELDDRDLLKEALEYLMEELEDLKINGIELDGEIIPVCLMFLLGDSLGQHQMGSFVRSFSSEYFCRFCHITRTEFKAKPNTVKEWRTPATYDSDVDYAKKMWIRERNRSLKVARRKKLAQAKNQAEKATSRMSAPGKKSVTKKLISKWAFDKLRSLHHRGVKYRSSPFNSIKLNFHVCRPAMPVCISHDLYEGLFKCIVAGALKYFIEKKQWFDFDTLNRRIKAFKCKGSDRQDAPTPLKNLDELSGHAVENWNMIRLLPFIIGDLIQDPEDDMWELVLSLKEISEYVSAPKITVDQICYLKLIIKIFLTKVKELEEHLENCVIPKLHYLSHYADLIWIFGPLIRLATLRYESRHVFFKRVVKACKNFKNVTYTMAKKYMCRFAYDHSSEILPPDIEYDPNHSEKLNLRTLSAEQVTALPDDLDVDQVESLQAVIIKGIKYEVGSYLIVGSHGLCDLTVGCINMILLTDSNSASFILEQKKGTNSFQGYYSLSKFTDDEKTGTFIQKSLDNLPDYYPLPSYDYCGSQCLSLKHSVICMK